MDYKKECADLKADTIEDHSLDRWKEGVEKRVEKYLRVE
jgi:hypothetical protein